MYVSDVFAQGQLVDLDYAIVSLANTSCVACPDFYVKI